MTPIRFSRSSLRESHWYEYLIRFVLGGGATVFTGFISSHYGPSFGGLFLALPAIFCASATLIETHEIRRKRKAHLAGEKRGREAAALDAAGAALGALGLLAFAMTFLLIVESSVSAAFIGASLVWLVVSVAAWCVQRTMHHSRRRRRPDLVPNNKGLAERERFPRSPKRKSIVSRSRFCPTELMALAFFVAYFED